MLLAEIQGKIRGTFGCTACGNDGMSLEAAVAVEDALTSTVFGALRWLRPELGLLPLLRRLELPLLAPEPSIRLWPRDGVPVIGIGDTKIAEVGCEPDVIIDVPAQSLTLVEVKLGAVLGAEPLQLPKEAIFAHRHARGRPWRLLCVTPGASPPRIQGFRVEGNRLALSDRMPLADAVASYFAAATPFARSADWPSAPEVRASVCWMSWSSFGALLETVRAQASTAQHEGNLLDDVVALLRRRGLMRPTFHGFEIVPARPLGWGAGVLWRRGQRSLWNVRAKVTPWSAVQWLSGEIRTRSGFQGFGALSAKGPTPWPKLRWFSTDARKRR
jgi:hypothetical protein